MLSHKICSCLVSVMSENLENRSYLGLLNFLNFYEGVIFIVNVLANE